MDLRPLNFLVGANSSGKSSFLEFFPLIQQSMFTNRDGAFLWVGDNVDLNGFQTVVRDGERTITIEAEIDEIPIDASRNPLNKKYIRDVRFGFDITKTEYGDTIAEVRMGFNGQQIVMQLRENESDKVFINGELISYPDETIIHSPTNSMLPKLLFEGDVLYTESKKGRKELYTWVRQKQIKADEERDDVPPLLLFRVRNLIDKSFFEEKIGKYIKGVVADDIDHIYNLAIFTNINEFIDLFNYYMLDFANHIEFVQPLRASAERYYRKRNISVNKISPTGDNIAIFFLRLKKERKLALFNNWLSDNDFGFKVDIDETGGFVEIKIVEEGKGGMNIVDVGFGYSQILPILATIWKELFYIDSSRQSTRYCATNLILIEQPELHLHPRFQIKFSDLLIKCAQLSKQKNVDIKFIIETHSKDIINNIGRNIAYKKFLPSLVNIYVFNAQRENMQKYIEKVGFTVEGFLENWPVGFFS